MERGSSGVKGGEEWKDAGGVSTDLRVVFCVVIKKDCAAEALPEMKRYKLEAAQFRRASNKINRAKLLRGRESGATSRVA